MLIRANDETGGSLTVVGTGIQAAGQITVEARTCLQQSAKVFYLVADPTTAYYICKLNQNAESLHTFYETGKERFVSYMEMVEHILSAVESGISVCAAFYGHPGVFAYPSHEAIRRAREKGFPARMLPGVSAEDCLFADLGLDPAAAGCQSFEATDFLIFRRQFDTNSSLILWQIGVIGDVSFQENGYSLAGVGILSDYLGSFYGTTHSVIVYEASHYPMYDSKREKVTIADLKTAHISPMSTLYVPPKSSPTVDLDMARRLGMEAGGIRTITMRVASVPHTARTSQ